MVLVKLDLEKITIRGEFPAAGRTAGIGHEMFKKQDKGMITLGFGSNFVVFRCDEVQGFDVNEIVAKLKDQAPHTLSDGGGHAFAGSIKFLSAAKDEVLKIIDEYVQQFF
jgi:RecJ-like exonuclease